MPYPVDREDVLLLLRALNQTHLHLVALVGLQERRERVAVNVRVEDVRHVTRRVCLLHKAAAGLLAYAKRYRFVAIVDELRAGIASRD